MAGDLLKMKKRLKISFKLSLKMLRGAYMNRQERDIQRWDREVARERERREKEREREREERERKGRERE